MRHFHVGGTAREKRCVPQGQGEGGAIEALPVRANGREPHERHFRRPGLGVGGVAVSERHFDVAGHPVVGDDRQLRLNRRRTIRLKSTIQCVVGVSCRCGGSRIARPDGSDAP